MSCICEHENEFGNDKRICQIHKKEIRVDSSIPKVAGYNLRSHKSTGSIVICSQEEAQLYHKISARNNGIVANGVRMNRK